MSTRKFILLFGLVIALFLNSKGQVVINELMIKPGSDSDAMTSEVQAMFYTENGQYYGQEWVELYNPTCKPIDIGCWVLQCNVGDGSTGEGSFTIPTNTTIPPGGYFVIGGANVANADIKINSANLITNNACGGSPTQTRWHLQNGNGYLVLFNANLQIEDAIYWDSDRNNLQTSWNYDNPNGCIAASSCNHPAVAIPMGKDIVGIEYIGDVSPVAITGKSAKRSNDGSMTWAVGATPTPGSANGIASTGSLAIQLTIDSATCGLNNGEITALTNSGTAPYTYEWSNTLTTQKISNLAPGSYNVKVTDNSGCTGSATGVIVDIPGPTATTTVVNSSCGQSNGSITANATGGRLPYTYNWNTHPSQGQQTASNIGAGTYQVIITDGNGCTATATGSVLDSGAVVIQLSSTPSHCNQPDGSATVSYTPSGSAQIMWNGNPAQSAATISNLVPGTYNVVVDNGICPANGQVIVGNIPGPKAQMIALPSIVKIDNPTVMFKDQSTGNNINQWDWDFGDGNTSNSQNPSNNYNHVGLFNVRLTITDQFGCKDSTYNEVLVKDVFYLYIPNAFTPDQDGNNDLFFPKGVGYNDEKYTMDIYDRWGEHIFSTNDITVGWNGTMNNTGTKNQIVHGIYVYRIVIADKDGLYHRYVGNVTLLK